jgi:hypothetical protein
MAAVPGSNQDAKDANDAKPAAASPIVLVQGRLKGFANLLPKRIILLAHSPNSNWF